MMRNMAKVILTVMVAGALLGACAKKQTSAAAKSAAPEAAEPKSDKEAPAEEGKKGDGASEDPCSGGE